VSRSPNARLAVDQFLILAERLKLTKLNAWHGIALLLLSCDVWADGFKRLKDLRGNAMIPDVVVYRERNDFKVGARGPNIVVQRARSLTAYIGHELGIPQGSVCEEIGQYWRDPVIATMQPHNLVGHAFRSICLTILEKFGDPEITYDEEVDPSTEFPGHHFSTRSDDAKIDIIARRGKATVAMISVRWRFRHDRVDVVEEALAYGTAARRANPDCALYALVGEFAPNRLEKILSNCPPRKNPPLDACIHFAPELLSQGLGENGRLTELKSLAWLADESFKWR
jgi:hypothetical protein